MVAGASTAPRPASPPACWRTSCSSRRVSETPRASRPARRCSWSPPTPPGCAAPPSKVRHGPRPSSSSTGRGRRRRPPRWRRRGRRHLDRRARDRRAVHRRGRRLRLGTDARRRVHEDEGAVRQAHRHVPGGGPAGGGRLRRRRGGAPHRLAGGLAPVGRPAGHRRGGHGQSSGRPTAASAWSTPPLTCMAAWESTGTTRCTASSSSPSRSS